MNEQGKNVGEMGVDECIRWLEFDNKARELGFGHGADSDCPPIPATLEAAALSLPGNWVVSIENFRHPDGGWQWSAYGTRREAVGTRGCCGENVRNEYADTELLARFRLAVSCRIANQQTGANQ